MELKRISKRILVKSFIRIGADLLYQKSKLPIFFWIFSVSQFLLATWVSGSFFNFLRWIVAIKWGLRKKIRGHLENSCACGKFPKKCFLLQSVILVTYDHFFTLVSFPNDLKIDAALSENENHLLYKFCANWVIFTTPEVPPNLSKAPSKSYLWLLTSYSTPLNWSTEVGLFCGV